MIIKANTEALKPALALAGRAVATRSTLPITACVLIETVGGNLRISATDLDHALRAECGAKVEEEGAIVVPYHLLSSWVGALPSAILRIERRAGEPRARLECARMKATMPVYPADEFPRIDWAADSWAGGEFATEAFNETVRRALIAVADDDARPVLNGIHVRASDGQAQLASADGFRLSVATMPCERAFPGVIVHAGAWKLALEASKAHPAAPVAFAVNDSLVRASFRVGTVEIVTQLIQGTFPNWQALKPKEWTTRISADVSDLSRALRAATVYAREGSSEKNKDIIRLYALPSREGEMQTLRVRGEAAQVGDQDGEVDMAFEGDGLHIAFHSGYLADVLSVASGRIEAEFTSPQSQGVFRQAGDAGWFCVVMPMFVQWQAGE